MTRAIRLLPLLAALAVPAASWAAQEAEPWEGQTIHDIRGRGWVRHRFATYRQTLKLRKDGPYDKSMRDSDLKALFKTNHFNSVDIRVDREGERWVATVVVEEYSRIADVVFSGVLSLPLQTLRPGLRLNPEEELNPYLLKVDQDYLREKYLEKGYAFFEARPEILETPEGVVLHWRVSEGPLVTVRDVILTGIPEEEADRVKEYLLNQGRSTSLGFIPTAGDPFVPRYLDEDLKRIRLFFYLDGWLDIASGERVFVEDLVYSRDKTEVTVRIHVDRGRRYRITRVSFAGHAVFSEEELRAAITSKEETDYSDNAVNRDVGKIRELYGERAYIMAEVKADYILDPAKPEVAVSFSVTENEEITIGRILVQGNTKTRYDVILRELRDFAPGEKFNNRLLSRGIGRLRNKGFFEPTPQGVTWKTEAGAIPNERDVVIDVKEGQTGNIRFAGGYSSSFGILGILEFSQRNFDITDLPHSVEDFFSGNAFAGGGQFFRIRAAPSAKRQSFLVEFKEPFVFGHEFGFDARGVNISSSYSSWDEERLGTTLAINKRIDQFRFDLKFEASRIEIEDIDLTAPSDTFDVEGLNYLLSVTPGVAFDTRDYSLLFPISGVYLGLSYEYAGGFLSGDWNFGKFLSEAEVHFTVLETEEKSHHVLSFQSHFRWAEPFGDTEEIPIFERFFAGGRDSIRGFEFRGVGAHENGDPVGGSVLLLGTVEYTYPVFGEFLRGAFFYDIGNLADAIDELDEDKFRNTVGFGIRFVIPQLGNIPVALDFGFPLTREDEDERQTVTFDIGKLF